MHLLRTTFSRVLIHILCSNEHSRRMVFGGLMICLCTTVELCDTEENYFMSGSVVHLLTVRKMLNISGVILSASSGSE